jgi:hypothetical protein
LDDFWLRTALPYGEEYVWLFGLVTLTVATPAPPGMPISIGKNFTTNVSAT